MSVLYALLRNSAKNARNARHMTAAQIFLVFLSSILRSSEGMKKMFVILR